MVLPAPFQRVNGFSFPFKHLAINPPCVYFAAAEVSGKDFASSTLLLTSTFLQHPLYPKLGNLSTSTAVVSCYLKLSFLMPYLFLSIKFKM